MEYAARRLGLAVALGVAMAPIAMMKWWAFAVTVPALAAAALLDPDLDLSDLSELE